MAVPKRRHSKTRKRTRRAHDALDSPGLSVCKRCNQASLPHRVCENCGHYAGREVIEVEVT